MARTMEVSLHLVDVLAKANMHEPRSRYIADCRQPRWTGQARLAWLAAVLEKGRNLARRDSSKTPCGTTQQANRDRNSTFNACSFLDSSPDMLYRRSLPIRTTSGNCLLGRADGWT